MKRLAGFTLVELLVTISVMVILLTLGTVALTGYQVNARDEERTTDIGVITKQLEAYYNTNGEYPATDVMNTESAVDSTLPDVDPRALRDPLTPTTATMSFTVATNTSVPTIGSLNGGKTYIYQPLTSTNALCNISTLECRKFNLYYTLETDLTVKTITSKHQ